MNLRSSLHPGARLLVAALLLGAGMAAQALDIFKPFKNLFSSEEVIVWQGPGQFVKIVDQDRIKKDHRSPKNSHPSDLTAGQLATVFASLKLDAGGKAAPIFTPSEVTLLAEKIADGLHRASPQQDVVFAIAGGQETAGTQTTAGRVFVEGGRLQIIFGDVHGPVASDASNTSYFTEPHRAGKRRERVDRNVAIAAGPGISYSTANDFDRHDWVMIDVPALLAARGGPAVMPVLAPTPVAAPGTPATPQATTLPAAAPPAAAPVTPPVATMPVTADQQKQLEERRQMLEEMARLRKQVQEQQSAAGGTPAPAAAGSTPAPAKPAPGGKSLEERLATLQTLHEKKLITDEEYAAKRKALLEEL